MITLEQKIEFIKDKYPEAVPVRTNFDHYRIWKYNNPFNVAFIAKGNTIEEAWNNSYNKLKEENETK